jgi:hypothetical protein
MTSAKDSTVTSKVQQTENRHDEAGSEKETRTAGFGQTVLEPFLVFLRLGLTSFGGPIAHLGYFRQEFVERRKWLTEQTFADLVALCNFLPGPTSSRVSYSIGMTRGGIPGAISAWSAFTLPSAIIMLLAAYGIHWVSGEQGASWLHGLKVVAVGRSESGRGRLCDQAGAVQNEAERKRCGRGREAGPCTGAGPRHSGLESRIKAEHGGVSKTGRAHGDGADAQPASERALQKSNAAL